MAGQTSSSSGSPNVSMLAAAAVVVADMIGVGVFTSLGFQIEDIASSFALLMLWFVGGVVALCGAFCYAELTVMFPRSSGEYNLLGRAYNPAIGFLAGWLSATVGFAAPVALAAMAFGEYGRAIVPDMPPLASGLVIIFVTAAVHLTGTRHGSLFQIASTLLKIALIVAFVAAGFSTRAGPAVSFAPRAIDPAHIIGAPFAISLVFVMYSYSGWNAATYIVSELRDPRRTVPRALFFGTAVVIVLYIALNAVFLYTTPMRELAGKIDVAMIAGTHIFGAAGARLAAGLICIGLISTVSAMMWIGPRVAMVMGEDIRLLRPFAARSKNGAPTFATILQLAISSLLLLTQSFEAVLDFVQFSLTLCSFLTVLGMVKLRVTRPDLPRPYRAWGYPLTPFLFLSVSLFIMGYLIAVRPIQSFAGFLMVLAGLVIYAFANMQQTAARRALYK